MIKYSSWDGFATARQAGREGQGEGLNAWFGLLRGTLESVPKEAILPHAHWKKFTLTAEEENQVFKLLVAQRVLPRGCILQTLRVALGLPYRGLPYREIETDRTARVERVTPANARAPRGLESDMSRSALGYFAQEVGLILGNPKEMPNLIAALTWPGNVVRLDEWQKHMHTFGVPVQPLVEGLRGSSDFG
jgi:hypothetical protein